MTLSCTCFFASTIILSTKSQNLQSRCSYLEKSAVELGYANHNPTNGVWQWKESVESK